jgi:hypothetical protein
MITHLLLHRCRIWRPTDSTGTFSQNVRSYGTPPVYNQLRCEISKPATTLTMMEGGLTTQGTRTVYFDIGPLLKQRDVIEIYHGPNAPVWVEADQPPYNVRDHHLEIKCVEFRGRLPTMQEVS